MIFVLLLFYNYKTGRMQISFVLFLVFLGIINVDIANVKYSDRAYEISDTY